MNYFIGVVPPADIKEKVLSFQRSFPHNDLPDRLEPHITLKAYAGLTDDLDWVPKVKAVIKEHHSFSVTLDGVGGFGDSFIFLKPTSSDALDALHRAFVQVIQPSAEESAECFEKESYHPHLTLGTKWSMPANELAEMKEKAPRVFSSPITFEVTFIRIFKRETQDHPWVTMEDVALK
jgi:2'-5' RNA ligase